MAKLTKRILDQAAPRERDYFIWCDELKGFGARILPGGQKSFVIQYRDEHRRSRRYTIGRYGHLTAEQARSEAMRKLGSIRFGENPAEDKRRKQADMLMRDLCDQYFEDSKSGRYLTRFNRPKKATTIATDMGRTNAHIKPLLGSRPVGSIDRRTVEDFFSDVRTGKTGKREKSGKPRGLTLVRGGNGTARRTLGLLGAIMTYACDMGIRETNPVRGVKRGVDNKRTRFFRESEYRALGQALRDAEANGINPTALNAIRALALSGCRLGEITSLTRREVDEQYGCFRFDDTKTGAQTRPAGAALFRLLNEQPVDQGTQYIFPATRGGGKFDGMRKVWLQVCALAEIEDATMHTLRHSYASVAAELNYSDATIAALLGHSLGTITSRYMHFVDEALRAAADKVSNEIEQRLNQPPVGH